MSKGIFQKIFKVKEKPFSAWQVELTTRCPLKCRMCIREGCKEWHSADMSMDNFKKLIPYFKDVESVVLSGWGEPLLYKNLIESIRLVKKCGAKAGFVTSGKGLNKEYTSDLISAGTDFIGFSLAGATPETHSNIRINSDFNDLLNNIQTFIEIKKDRKRYKPDLHIVYLMLKDNISEVPSIIKLAKDIGINMVILTNIIHVTNKWQEKQRVFTCDESLKPPLLQSAYRMSLREALATKQSGIENKEIAPLPLGARNDKKEADSLSVQKRGGIDYEEILKEAETKAKELKIRLRRPSLCPIEVPVCDENPLSNLYISVDGNVSPCVYLYPPTSSPFKRVFCGDEHYLEKLSFGNIFNESFDKIWNSQRYSEFRGYLIRRGKNLDKMFFSVGDRESIKKLTTAPLPEPPEQCRICHKMLGV